MRYIPERIKISSLEELDNALEQDIHDFIIWLGVAYSSKEIYEAGQKGYYAIYNHIDDTEQVLSREQIMDEDYTNIGKAMERGAFYAEKY